MTIDATTFDCHWKSMHTNLLQCTYSYLKLLKQSLTCKKCDTLQPWQPLRCSVRLSLHGNNHNRLADYNAMT